MKLFVIVYFIFFCRPYLVLCDGTDDAYINCCIEGTYYNVTSNVCEDAWLFNMTTPTIIGCDSYYSHINGTYGISFLVKDRAVIIYKDLYTKHLTLDELSYCIATTEKHELALVTCINRNLAFEGLTLQNTFIVMSGCFFALTAIIYSILPELRDLQGKVIASLCGSSSLGWFATVILHQELSTMSLCTISGFATYFLMMSSFFWMNALAVQVYRSIRHPDTVLKFEFIYYSLYAWGSPFLLLLCAIFTSYLAESYYFSSFLIGSNCWFSGAKELWTYFYGPLAIILVVNCIIFARSVIILMWGKQQPSQRVRSLTFKIWMSVRIFIVVGIMWVFELANAITEIYPTLWTITEIYNLLQGLIVFVVLVVLRRRVLLGLARSGLLCHNLRATINLLPADDDEATVQIIEELDNTDGTVEVSLEK